MEKSNTVDISKIEETINQAVVYVKDWTQNQFKLILNDKLNKNQIPLIVDMNGKGYLLGTFAIIPMENKLWKLTNFYSDNEYVFSSKISAVCYAVYMQTSRKNLADKILTQDQNVCRLRIKVEHYKYCQTRAKKQKNYVLVDVFNSRYENYVERLAQAKSILEKSLKLTKYYNV